MQNIKLPLYDADNSERNRWRETTKTNTVFYVLVILALMSVFAYWSWRNINLFNGNYAKHPFNPPPRDDLAKTARYIAHYMDWCMISTISVAYNGIPIGYPVSIADGPVNNSTGVPYIYISPFSPASQDLEKNASSSFSFSEAQSDYCSRNDYDVEDPRCARLALVGKVVKLTADEIPFAKEALFSRHPVMKYWPVSHKFFFAKLEISFVHLLDYFGSPHEVPVKDYFAAKV